MKHVAGCSHLPPLSESNFNVSPTTARTSQNATTDRRHNNATVRAPAGKRKRKVNDASDHEPCTLASPSPSAAATFHLALRRLPQLPRVADLGLEALERTLDVIDILPAEVGVVLQVAL